MNTTAGPVLLFDGDCAFCNDCVRWLLAHERRPRYGFAPLQSQSAEQMLSAHGLSSNDLSSLVVIDEGVAYRKSTAALHLLRETRWHWQLLRVFTLVPRALRDRVYDFVGDHRYRWWGKGNSCVTADPSTRSRVLPSDST